MCWLMVSSTGPTGYCCNLSDSVFSWKCGFDSVGVLLIKQNYWSCASKCWLTLSLAQYQRARSPIWLDADGLHKHGRLPGSPCVWRYGASSNYCSYYYTPLCLAISWSFIFCSSRPCWFTRSAIRSDFCTNFNSLRLFYSGWPTWTGASRWSHFAPRQLRFLCFPWSSSARSLSPPDQIV